MDDVGHVLDGRVVGAGGEDVSDVDEGEGGAGVELFDGLSGQDIVCSGLRADGSADMIAGFEGVDHDAEAQVARGAGDKDDGFGHVDGFVD